MWTLLSVLCGALGLACVLALPRGLVPAWKMPSWWNEEPEFLPSKKRDQVKDALVQELPQFCELLAVSLAAGLPLSGAAQAVCEVTTSDHSADNHTRRRRKASVEGELSARIKKVCAEVALGASEIEAWSSLESEPVLVPFAGQLTHALRTGAGLDKALRELVGKTRQDAFSALEVKARAVSVKSSLPLSLCFLPAFFLLGVVPIIASVFAGINFSFPF
ncbi:MAG: type II secretion system F family protein [Propionibacteriaceae bacterium]|jgi:pilus assembly protein TadC|nr:type II secretion system F family protein [Propionibacteriaceae bacterium]